VAQETRPTRCLGVIERERSESLEPLERIEAAFNPLIQERTAKEWYTTEEMAKIVGKAEFTVREWCRNGRIHAEKGSHNAGPSPPGSSVTRSC